MVTNTLFLWTALAWWDILLYATGKQEASFLKEGDFWKLPERVRDENHVKGAHPMCSWTCVCFPKDPQVLSTAVVTEKCLQQARQEQPARKITADNQNHCKNNPCLTCLTAQHCNSWIKSLKISDDHKWQRYMMYLHAPFPNIALLVLAAAVVEVFLQEQCLPRATAFAKLLCQMLHFLP